MFHIPAHKNADKPAAQFDASNGPRKPQSSRRPLGKAKARPKDAKRPRPFVMVESARGQA